MHSAERCVGAGGLVRKGDGCSISTISLLEFLGCGPDSLGRAACKAMQVRFNGYVISLPLSQIGSGGGGAAELKKEA